MLLFAVIKTGGKQYKVAEGDKILIEKIEEEIGKEFNFNEVLLIGSGSTGSPQVGSADKAKIGQPFIKDAKVKAKVLEHGKAKKKIVFKYSSKTRYKKKKGHRQPFTKVEILKIV